MKFSVLMSVYSKDNPNYLEESLKSILLQTSQAAEIILVEDGNLTVELDYVIKNYSQKLPIVNVKILRNKGLAAALNEGLKFCTYDLVLRMDSDDIAMPFRFEKQVAFMRKNSQISVSSSWIEERYDMLKVGFVKKLPEKHFEILVFSKRRSPINHPVAIFRKKDVIAVGGYPLIFPEDYALWSLMLVKDYKFANIPEVLLQMRTGSDFMSRRGINFFKGEIKLLKYQKDIGFLTSYEYLINLIIRASLRLPPPIFRKLLYQFAR